ncbi:angiogenic factor with G patch and FHA domains 1-like isoform X2 [Mucor ambiguus]|uniref:Angiogenic factor with G patch and FHA domains 1-like isoform X2 n=1 Tax=Mucor ambiguus TaxID=91626 RepID=A0A0C9LZM5_9FUNG|nr:angiogenic factor with G patch and FHA domains 1-like isoform X2 [Mucor ambiguus]
MSNQEHDFGTELDSYINKSAPPNQGKEAAQADWIFDESTGVYVIHDKRLVMYFADENWVCGDYDTVYNNRYMFDSETQAWFDTVTKQYSFYDEASQSYVPLTDAYWAGHPQSTQSIRLVIQSSPHFQSGQVILVDENGISIGRDRSWDSRLRLPEMIVSKYHAMVFLDKKEKAFFMIDNGSQHGTYVNEKRLSEPKQSSLPYELRHSDIIRIGSTSLQVHQHDKGWPCQDCLASEYIDTTSGKKDKVQQQQKPKGHIEDLETSRREWIKKQKKLYALDDDSSQGYVDRAHIRRKTTKPEKFVPEKQDDSSHVGHDTQHSIYRTSTTSSVPPVTVHTPVQGIGNKMLQKLGWQEGQSLGKRQDGILEPIAPASQLSRTGLGSQQAATATATQHETRKEMQWRLAQQRYQNAFSNDTR